MSGLITHEGFITEFKIGRRSEYSFGGISGFVIIDWSISQNPILFLGHGHVELKLLLLVHWLHLVLLRVLLILLLIIVHLVLSIRICSCHLRKKVCGNLLVLNDCRYSILNSDRSHHLHRDIVPFWPLLLHSTFLLEVRLLHKAFEVAHEPLIKVQLVIHLQRLLSPLSKYLGSRLKLGTCHLLLETLNLALKLSEVLPVLRVPILSHSLGGVLN